MGLEPTLSNHIHIIMIIISSRTSGLSVLDLGSGSGRDCYAAMALVGESGRVTGVDMTAEQLVTARKYNESFCKDLGHKTCNLEFVEGYIEKLADAGEGDRERVCVYEHVRMFVCMCVYIHICVDQILK